ncbi:MAG TPA: Fic family protein [Vicinamibacterales bacterium]|nr:Fic family protein [Vicinamibacterales bacterium]
MGGRLIERVWEANLERDAPARYRKACRYQAFVPDPLAGLDLMIDLGLAGLVSEAEAEVQRLNDLARPALLPLSRLLLRTESIASSKVEGLAIDAKVLARAKAKLDAGERHVSPTAVDILANINAMETAIHDASSVATFGVQEIVSIHERLLEKSVYSHLAGRIRSEQNWIGGNDYNPCGADFVPPPPEEVSGLLDDLCAAINDDTLPPIVQAALVHAQFETIHPFGDGNGRVGRALIHVVLRRRGVAHHYVPPISVFFARKRDRYIAGLMRFRDDDGLPAWIEHFAAATAGAARLAARYLDEVAGLDQEWRDALVACPSSPRSDATAWMIIDELPAYPYITAPLAVAATRRSRPQVYEAIEQLVAAGILISAGKAGRAQVYEVRGLLDLMKALERGGLNDNG